MEAKEFIEACDDVFEYFNNEEETTNKDGLTTLRMYDFFDQFLESRNKISDFLIDQEYRVGNEHIVDYFQHFQSDLRASSFAIGFVMGNMFDLIRPEVQEKIHLIKKMIREKQLLPYLPKERKGGSHEEINP